MSSSEHEVLADLFQQRPALAGELLVMLGALPQGALSAELLGTARLDSESFRQLEPPQYAADKVVLFGGPARPAFGVVVEVQRGRDDDKRGSWPLYLVHLWARHRCPVYLVVIAPHPSVARWCAQPIALGHPGLVLQPLVVGPQQIPRVTTVAQARANLPLAVLSAVAHARHDPKRVGRTVLQALLSEGAAARYPWIDLVLTSLPAGAAEWILEELMSETHEFKSEALRGLLDRGREEGREKGREEGREEGKAEAILMFLAARGIEVPTELADEIRACRDVDTLNRWIDRAALVPSAEALLE